MWKCIFGVMKQLRGTFDKMDKEKRRKLDLILYGGAAIVSFFALYTFIFIFDNGMGWKIALIIIGIGWLLSAISGFLKALKK